MKQILGWMMAATLIVGLGTLWADETANTGNSAGAVATPTAKAKTKAKAAKKKESKDVYECPMCHITSEKAGKCPMCGMDMVKQKKAPAQPGNKPSDGKSKDTSSSQSQGLDVAKYGKGADARVCPVSGDKIKAGKGVELALANGKRIMVCCPDCQKDIEKDPAKYASLMY